MFLITNVWWNITKRNNLYATLKFDLWNEYIEAYKIPFHLLINHLRFESYYA